MRTWTALDADTKLIVSYFVGDRSGQSAIALMDDLRVRIESDGSAPKPRGPYKKRG